MTIIIAEETKRPRHAHIFERDLNDRYVEPAWCSARLFEEESFRDSIHDPAASTGQILAAARAAGLKATGADLAPLRRSTNIRAVDFLEDRSRHDNIVSNPPYDQMREFAEQALALAQRKVALLVPVARLNAAHWLQRTPLQTIWLLTPRPSIPPLSYLRAGRKPGGGRVDFAWLVWARGYHGHAQVRWLTREPGRHR